MRIWMLGAGISALLLAGCGDGAEQGAGAPPAGGTARTEAPQTAPSGDAGSQVTQSLQRAGEAAGEVAKNLGEAGGAAVESLKENAPEIRQNIEEGATKAGEVIGEAGQRLKNAAEAFVNEPVEAPAGDSPADPNRTPERQEGAAPQ